MGMGNIALGMGYLATVTVALCVEIKISKEQYKEAIIYVVACACIALWVPLALTENVAYDHGYTVATVRHSFKEIAELCSKDVHSPLYYYIAKIFYNILGKSNCSLKLCSLFFMALFYLFLVFPFKKEFGRRVTLYVLLITTFLPTVITHCSEPRMYSMAFVAFSCLCFTAYKMIKNYKRTYVAAFFLLSVFCVYIHTYTMIAAVFLYLVLAGIIIFGKNKEKKKLLISFPIVSILVSASYIPWLSVLIAQFSEKENYGGELQSPWELISEIIVENFSSVMNSQLWQSIFGVAFLASMLAVIIIKKSSLLKKSLIYFGIFLAVSTVGVILASTNSPCFMGRYASCASLSLILIISAGLTEIKNQKIVSVLLITFIFSGLLVYKNELKLQYDTAGIDEYNDFIDNNLTSDDAIMYSNIHSNMLSIYHPDIYTYKYGSEEEFNPFRNDEIFREFEQLEKIDGNLYLVCFTPNTPSDYFKCEYDEIMTFHYMYYDFSLFIIWNFKQD